MDLDGLDAGFRQPGFPSDGVASLREGDVTVLCEHGRYHVDDDIPVTWVSHNYGPHDLCDTDSLVLSVAVVSTKMFLVLPAIILESTMECQLCSQHSSGQLSR